MDNLRGASLMVLSMLGFAIEDMFIKLTADALPVGQILAILGFGGALIFAALLLIRKQPLFTREMLSLAVFLRAAGEVIGALGFVTAIALTPISSASAILQATPLAVTLGAALFLKEPVGWRRWSAIFVGFLGVLMIIRPGLDDFNALSLFALLGVLGLVIRDLSTRAVPATINAMQLSLMAFSVLVPAGLGLLLATNTAPVMPSTLPALYMGGALIISVFAYYAIVGATRIGDISFVTPFRYTRLIFALIVGITVFDESPDMMTLAGAAIIVASGSYTVWREQRLRRRAQRQAIKR